MPRVTQSIIVAVITLFILANSAFHTIFPLDVLQIQMLLQSYVQSQLTPPSISILRLWRHAQLGSIEVSNSR